MKKLKLDVEALQVEQLETEVAAVQEDEGTVHAMSGWYSDPCRFCDPFPISDGPNVC